MANTSGNKGEWSEIYTFIKLLNDGRIYAANENLQRMSETMYFPIIKIRREETKGEVLDYCTGEKIKIYHNDSFIKEIELSDLSEQSEFLYNEMFSKTKGNLKLEGMGDFNDFLNNIFVTKIKAGSGQKADIIMEIIDINTGFRPLAGFSIKSQIGSPSTLMNASGATNLIYKINGINDDIMEEINAINTKEKIIDRFTKLYSIAETVEFYDVKNTVFRDNLEMIDSKMPDILAFAMVYRYRDNIKQYKDIVNLLCQNNPMNYHNREIYRYKFKKLLCASALGMLPATQWNGVDEANGGYIIVKSDGDILAYYLHNRNAFEDYLLRSTYLETGSTSKHGFATIYKDNGEYFINMNVQIRFKA